MSTIPTGRRPRNPLLRRRLFLEALEDRRLMATDFQNAFNEFDVRDDGVVSPVDALLVINQLLATGSRPLPPAASPPEHFIDVSGDRFLSPVDALLVINVLNHGLPFVALSERAEELAQEDLRILDLPPLAEGSRTIKFDVATRIDESDPTAALEDHLLVYIVNPANPQETLLDRDAEGTTVFSLIGGRADFVPGLVRFDGRTVEIDATSLPAGEVGLKFQLISSDADNGSRVVVRNLVALSDPEGAPSPLLSASPPTSAIGGALDTGALAATSAVELELTNLRYDPLAARYAADVSASALVSGLGQTLAVVFPDLPAGVTLRNPSGTTAAGEAFLNLSPAIPASGLSRARRSALVTVEFDSPANVPLALHPQVLLGLPNAPPSFDPLPALQVLPGGVLVAPLAASDPEGTPVAFLLAPTGPLPNVTLSADGRLVVRPAPDHVGSYQVELIATDGAAEARQTVTLQVPADPLTTTRVSGVIQQTNGQPLEGLHVQIGPAAGLTASDGSFLLDLGTGPVVGDTLKIWQELDDSAELPFIAEKLNLVLEHELYAGVNNVIARPIFLPLLDLANATPINPNAPNTVTTPAIPGAEVFVAAHTLRDQQGAEYNGLLSITEVPLAQTPVALPDNLTPDLVVTIQPGEMVFAGSGAPLALPNVAGWEPGTMMDLWSIDPVDGDFKRVGVGQVAASGSVIETVSGGIRNSSWHFFSPQGPTADPPTDTPSNHAPQCEESAAVQCTTSGVELHTGAMLERHALASYQSRGVTRGVTLRYDSLRADPRPIIHFGYSDTESSFPDLQLIGRLAVRGEGFEVQVPGALEGEPGLRPGDNVWNIPAGRTRAHAALQADLRSAPTGIYSYDVQTQLSRSSRPMVKFGTTDWSGDVVHVSSVNSPFGSGWGIDGLQELVITQGGAALLIDGNGSELVFQPAGGGQFAPPPGDFSTLEQLGDGTFLRTMKDQTTYRFDVDGKLSLVQDRVGNQTRYEYEAGWLARIVDPAGLTTHFTYPAGEVQIVDPAGRTTRLLLDARGDLVEVIDPDLTSRRWQYDDGHRLISETDQRGFVERTEYDFTGRAVRAVRKDGTTIDLNPVQRQFIFPPEATIHRTGAPSIRDNPAATAQVGEANGRVIETQLDQAGQIRSQRDSIGALPTVARDAQNLVVQSANARGFLTQYDYDARGNLTELTHRLPPDPDAATYLHDLNRRLFRVDLESGALHLIGSTPQVMHDLALSSAGELYGLNDSGSLYRIDTATAATTLIGDTGPNRPALAFAPDDTLYAASNSLFRIDLLTGQATLVGSLGGFVADGDLAFDADGRLFMTTTTNRLVQINPQTAAVTDLGPLNFTDVLGLAFGANEQLYGFTINGRLLQIDVATGAGTLLTTLSGTPSGQIGGAASKTPRSLEEIQLFTFDPTFSKLTSHTDERGNVTTFVIDPANGNVNAIDRPLGHHTEFTYTPSGQIDTLIDAQGRLNDYDYDPLGRLERITFALGTPDEAFRRYFYDQNTTAGRAGLVTSMQNENGALTQYAYDALNRLTQITGADPDGPGLPLASPVTTFGYDAAGNLTTINDANSRVTTYEFDSLGRMVLQTEPDPDFGGPLSGAVSTFAYDALGNLLEARDPLGNVTKHSYDSRSRLVKTVDPDGGIVRFRYDLDGNLTALTDPLLNTTTFAYDARDRQVRETDPLGKSIRYAYDGTSNLIQKIDRNGRLTTYEYDALNRLREEVWDSPANTIAYDYELVGGQPVGNLQSVADASSHLTFDYDHRDRLASVDNLGTPNAPRVVVMYGYDPAGNVTSVSDTIDQQLAATTNYIYDPLNRLSLVAQAGPGLSIKRVDFAYNALGQTTRIARFADLFGTQIAAASTYAYDGQNRLDSITHQRGGGATLSFFDLAYDAASRITSIEDADGLTTYAHDDRGQLLAADRAAADPRGDEFYEYDANGNRIESSLHGSGYRTGPGNRLLTDGTYNYEYDHEGNTVKRTLIATGDYREFEWDHRNRLTAVIDRLANGTATQIVRFTYDGLDRRISKSVDTTPADAVDAAILHFVYDREDVLLDFLDADGSGPAPAELDQRYLHGPGIDQVLAQDDGQGLTSWLLTDHLGTVRDLVSSAGVVEEHFVYNAFGVLLSDSSPSRDSRFRFTGREFDDEISIHHYRARAYLSDAGRFASEDPLGHFDDLNLHRYVVNRPNALADPSGTYWWLLIPPILILINPTPESEPYTDTDFAMDALPDAALMCGFARGTEIRIGKNVRVAPFGNRTGHPTGRYPHYHRRPSNPAPPGQGIGRHRPWDRSPTDGSFFDRF
jgi:RHS repeat-associated protein